MAKITGYEYEYCCANYLKHHGFKDVRVTQGSGDQGIDIVARKHHHWYGIQCKYYSGPVGNKAVQEAYTGSAYRGCDRAMVITNSYFTDSAEKLAQTTGVELMQWMQPHHGKTLRRAVPKPEKKHAFSKVVVFAVIVTIIYYVAKYCGLIY